MYCVHDQEAKMVVEQRVSSYDQLCGNFWNQHLPLPAMVLLTGPSCMCVCSFSHIRFSRTSVITDKVPIRSIETYKKHVYDLINYGKSLHNKEAYDIHVTAKKHVERGSA